MTTTGEAVIVFGADAAAVPAAVAALRAGGSMTVAGFVDEDEAGARQMGEDLFPGRPLQLVRASAAS
jgi:hypothetical protein